MKLILKQPCKKSTKRNSIQRIPHKYVKKIQEIAWRLKCRFAKDLNVFKSVAELLKILERREL